MDSQQGDGKRDATAQEGVSFDAFAGRAREIEAKLRRLYADLIAHKQASGSLAREPRQEPLSFRLTAREGESTSSELFEQLRRHVDRLVQQETPIPRGRVYCHWCKSFDCDHSAPVEPRSVFVGFSQTGEPRWREFGSVLIDRRDPRVHRLYDDGAYPIALVQSAAELTEQQLQVYGKWASHFRLLGQLIVGYLRLGGRPGVPRANVALTVQAVHTGDLRRGALLNVIGVLPDGGSAFDALEADADPRLIDAISIARSRLQDLSLLKSPRRQRWGLYRRRSHRIFEQLARNLERIFRQQKRRTRHSQDRHLDRRRPAATALQDALAADGTSIYRDVEEKTWVVLGPKNRVHVFNDDGLHITSVVYQGETVRQRTTRGKWLAPPQEELLRFQAALEKVGGTRTPSSIDG